LRWREVIKMGIEYKVKKLFKNDNDNKKSTAAIWGTGTAVGVFALTGAGLVVSGVAGLVAYGIKKAYEPKK
jgi:hypothetical protein